jgi:tetratricopeptide (TPR) repeat protein
MADERSFIDVEGLDLVEYASLVSVYEEALRRRRGDVEVLLWLGHAYTRLGRVEDGLRVDLALTALLPEDATVRYNLACSYALLGRTDEAIDTLERSIRLGYRDLDHLRTDDDLRTLRNHPRFLALLEPPGGRPPSTACS